MAGLIVGLVAAAAWAGGFAPPDRSRPMTAAGEFSFRHETAEIGFGDVLSLRNGARRVGRVMEWADQVLLYDRPGDPTCFAIDEVAAFELRRERRHLQRPVMPDLTVAYIERLPRDASLQGRIKVRAGVPVLEGDAGPGRAQPSAGSKVTFRVHVLNAGGAKSAPTTCKVAVGGAEVASAPVAALEAGQEAVVEAAWTWQEGKSIRVEIVAGQGLPEIAMWNNVREEAAGAIGVNVLVSRDLWKKFREIRNIVDTFCIEDWVQYQLRNFNGLLAASVYPAAPQGVLERVRCDRITVFDGGVEDFLLAEEQAKEPVPAARLLLDRPLRDRALVDHATQVDWAMLRELGRQIGLVDWSATDTTLEQCMVRDLQGRYVQIQHQFPYRRTLMCTSGGFPLAEPDAVYLNAARGRPRGAQGEFLYQVPATVTVEVLAGTGVPVEGVDIDGYQLMAEGDMAGTLSGAGGDPLFVLTTDAAGRAVLPNQAAPAVKTPGGYELKPNPFGNIAPDGSNGLLLLRLRKGGYEEYHLIRLFDCLLAAIRGDKAEYNHTLHTRFAAPGAPNAPPYTNGLPRDGGGFYVGWLMPQGTSGAMLEEFRIYRRVGLGGLDERPWLLDKVVRKVDGKWKFEADIDCFREPEFNGNYTLGTFAAAAFVDKKGRESAPAAVPAYFAHGRDVVAMAVTPEHVVYMTTAGRGEQQMLGWTGTEGTQPLGFRHRAFPNYTPAYAGVAIAQDRKVIVTDPINHVLAWYDRGDLVSTIPARTDWPGRPGSADGEFNDPADVAVDDTGRIYVTDRGNDRVQVLDANGQFIALLDPDFTRSVVEAKAKAAGQAVKIDPAAVFNDPSGIAYSNGRICVTDLDDTRVRVYDVKSNPPKFEYQATKLRYADRGLVNADGDLFVLGMSPVTREWGVLIFDREGDKALYRDIRTKVEGEIGNCDRPRGFCYFTVQGLEFGYLVNDAPFNIRRTLLMKKIPGPGDAAPGVDGGQAAPKPGQGAPGAQNAPAVPNAPQGPTAPQPEPTPGK